VIGSSRARTPVACQTAFATAPAAGDTDFTDALYSKSIHVRVVFLDQDRFESGNVGIHANAVLGQIGVHGAARTEVHDGVLMQCERHDQNHAAVELAAHQTRVDDPELLWLGPALAKMFEPISLCEFRRAQ
jgi:hypothetical protein